MQGGPTVYSIDIEKQGNDDDDYLKTSSAKSPVRRTSRWHWIALAAVLCVAVGGAVLALLSTGTISVDDASDSSVLEESFDAPVDSFVAAPSSISSFCPEDRRISTVCQEVYGMTYCGEAQSIENCHASCVKTIRVHLDVNYVCEPNNDNSRSIMAYIQNDPTHSSRQTPAPISRRTILERGVTWLKSRVRYSQRRYHSESSVSEGKRFRTDCTGYLSMAWGIPQIGTTSWVRSMKDQPSEGVTNHNKIFESIPCGTMRPGDALVNTGHIVLFRKWTNRTLGQFLVWESKGTVYGTVESSKTFVSAFDPRSSETGFRTTDSSTTYYCLRRRNLVDDDSDDDASDDTEEELPDDDTDETEDVFPGFNSACSLRPEMTERILDESHRAAGIWNMYGGYLQMRGLELGVRVKDLVAVLQIESGGKGFDKITRKPITRFENHVFKRMLENAGVYDEQTFNLHFRFDATRGWQGHMFRGGSLGNPTGSWQTFHGNQAKENEVLALAATWNEEAAYQSASYGLPQIMGFNYRMMNHESAKSMYASFTASIERQIDGLFAFLENSVKSCTGVHSERIAAIEHLRSDPPNYVAFACNYNGSGQKEYYGGRIRDAALAFSAFVRSSTTAASSSGTSCVVDGIAGFCVDDARCNGRSEPGYCPGASNIKCCIDCDSPGSV